MKCKSFYKILNLCALTAFLPNFNCSKTFAMNSSSIDRFEILSDYDEEIESKLSTENILLLENDEDINRSIIEIIERLKDAMSSKQELKNKFKKFCQNENNETSLILSRGIDVYTDPISVMQAFIEIDDFLQSNIEPSYSDSFSVKIYSIWMDKPEIEVMDILLKNKK